LHRNLQQLIIRIDDFIRSLIDETLNSYLSPVPNLKQLNVHLAILDSVVVGTFVDYDWLRLTVDDCLPLLEKFCFYVYFLNLIGFCESAVDSMISRMKEQFQIVYKDRYQSRFFIR
jgi:hypothetical protein